VNSPSRAIKLCGTEQPDVVGRLLRAGPMQVEFDNGQLRYLKVAGVEVLRAVGFLVRDENWGTYTPQISDLVIDQRADGFAVSFHAECSRPWQAIAYDARIEASADGQLTFTGTAVPKTDFLTARTGFVVLHPLKGVAGQPLTVEHVDGTVVESKFPPLVDPVQPFLGVRGLTHEVMPGCRATVRMEGDTFEMEDHRNWTDASFKTYVRPLALPWPYTLKAGEAVSQSIRVSLSGAASAGTAASANRGIEIKLGAITTQTLMPVGLGVPAEELVHAQRQAALLELAAPRHLQCHYDPRQGHGLAELDGFRALAELTGADVVLEIVVESVERFAQELRGVAGLVARSGLELAAVAVCPVGDLKSVLPGGPRPPAPPLEELYAAARAAFPGARIGGGMFSFFTELNRKRPPAHRLDFAMNTTCPIVHAADDRSVMETLEALPFQVRTARSFLGDAAHRVGPSAIGCRDNPHGATFTPNPNNQRVCLAKMDPRMRGLFGAAWTLGTIATLARTGIETLTIGAPTGPLGIIHRKTDYAQPYYDDLAAPAVYPVFHVIAGVSRGAGAKLVEARSSDDQKVQCLAYRAAGGGTTLWLANLTADAQNVRIGGPRSSNFGAMVGALLDESSFDVATSDPRTFQQSWRAMRNRIRLEPYAVAILAVNDEQLPIHFQTGDER
jgi:D-apionolactonase